MDQLRTSLIDITRENIAITSLLIVAVLMCADTMIRELIRRKNASEDLVFVCANRGQTIYVSRQYYKDIQLTEACRGGCFGRVKYLINEGADIHVDHEWPLREAIKNHHVEVIKLLVDAGADIHANDDQALQWCAEQAALDNYAQQVIPERASSDLAACIEACIFLVQKGSDIEAIRRCDCEDIYNLVARAMLKEQLETELKKDESPQPARRMKI